MRWSDLPLKPSSRMLRQFGVLWMVFFGGLAAWRGLIHADTRLALVFAVLALTLGPAGVVWPTILRPVFIAWVILAFPVGWVVSRVLLVTLFASMIPVALFFRLRGRDALRLRQRGHTTTYWTPKTGAESVRSYLRQS
jgi:hypothetical protein